MKSLPKVFLAFHVFGLLSILTATLDAVAAPSIMEQTDLFVAVQDCVFENRIPGIVTANQGTLIAF